MNSKSWMIGENAGKHYRYLLQLPTKYCKRFLFCHKNTHKGEVTMQAMILAAGMGRRMKKYTNHHTKSMIEVGGRTLLERVIEALLYAGIDKLVMVIGYEAETLREYIDSKKFPISIEYVYNNDYETTNNIYSLFLARDYLEADDTILLESDLIFEKKIIKDIVDRPEKNVVVVAKYEQWMDGTMVLLDSKHNIIDFVDKTQFYYDEVDKYYKTVNIYKFSKEFASKQYIPFMEAYLKAYGTNQYYEQVLKILAHIKNSELKAHILTDEAWYEIDDAQDLDIADTMFSDDKDILKKYEYHFGGYWRFPKLLDYCYLVNPYYPPKKMIEQMKYFYGVLCTQYPSGMQIQRLNAASMFDIDEEYLVVGNGAAELINVLGKIITGKVSISVPSFNEYVRCFTECEFRLLDAAANDYRYDLEKIIHEIDDTDNLVIINPDNPSGSFIPFQDMMKILDKCSKKQVKCIIDESFIDFADTQLRYTLLIEEILQKYPNLIVIKSISKSYGIPGLRLGVLATADRNIKRKVIEKMAIWNINSFAEYYLQIQRLYKKSYLLACQKIAEQREKMMRELSNIKNIEAYPSQANYIMCKINGEINSAQLAMKLVKEYNILIKDLSNKKGFGRKSYVRIAIKSEKENEIILQALKNILGCKA